MNTRILFSLVFCIQLGCIACNDHTIKSEVSPVVKDSLATTAKKEKEEEALPGDCVTTIYAIVESSKRFQSLTQGLVERIKKNGGSSYGLMLEGSPNPERDGAPSRSAAYEIALHESYPDRAVNIARFNFDPVRKQLFEYDPVEDTLLPILFNRELLADFGRNCR